MDGGSAARGGFTTHDRINGQYTIVVKGFYHCEAQYEPCSPPLLLLAPQSESREATTLGSAATMRSKPVGKSTLTC